MNVIFDIERIESGKFDAGFGYGSDRVTIPASSSNGFDAPKYFLKLLSILTVHQFDCGYVIFDGQSETFFVCIKKVPKVEIEVFYSNLYHSELTNLLPKNSLTGTAYCGKLSKEELKRKIPVGNVLFSAENFNWNNFVQDVIQTYELYLPKRKKRKYENNWFPFPSEELRKLKYDILL